MFGRDSKPIYKIFFSRHSPCVTLDSISFNSETKLIINFVNKLKSSFISDHRDGKVALSSLLYLLYSFSNLFLSAVLN